MGRSSATAAQPLQVKLVFDPLAEYEASEAIQKYEAEQPGLGEDFADQLDATLLRIEQRPHMAQAVSGKARRAVMHRFPYVVVYSVLASEIQILGVLPTRVNPSRLLSRAGTYSS